MANIPSKAVKKIKNEAHKEIAAGILLAYGLFPRTNEGIAAAQRLIAGRETWLAPSDLPNYYDNIESDLMTGKETAGIVNIRMLLKEFYGLDDSKPSKSQITVKKPKVTTGETTVYKPEDKFVDDITENLDKKLEETSNEIMDVVDALIEKQKKDFEDFKRKQEEERKRKKNGESQYSTPIGPDPMQGPKEPPRRTVAPENDEDWEGEVPDQLGTKLDELIDQVRTDPLPQPTKTKRKKTKGKKPISRKLKFDAREMGLGGSLNEILDNVIETRETLFNLYKLNQERFEFKKDVDQRLTQLLQAKIRESQIEKEPEEESSTKAKGEKDTDGENEKERKKSVLEQGLIAGLATTVGAMLFPLILEGFRPLFATKDEDEKKEEKSREQTEAAEERAAKQEEQNLEEPEQPVPTEETPAPAPVEEPATPQLMPVQDTSVPGDYDYNPPEQTPPGAIPFRKAAKGGKFTKGKHEKLKPLSKDDVKTPKVKKITKVLPEIIGLPQKAAAVGMLTFANSIISPFSPFIPKEGKDFINNLYRESAEMAGLKGFDVKIMDSESIFDKLKNAFESIFEGVGEALGLTPSTPRTNAGGGGTTSQSQKEVANVLREEFLSQGLSEEGANLAIAEIGRENSLRKDLILGTHDDNGKKAYGAVSWQGGREQTLFAELNARGISATEEGLAQSGDVGIKANAAAMVKEIEARGHTELLRLLKKSSLTDEEKDRVRYLMKEEYFVYNQSIPLQRSRDWYDLINKMNTPVTKGASGQAKDIRETGTYTVAGVTYDVTTGLPVKPASQPAPPPTPTPRRTPPDRRSIAAEARRAQENPGIDPPDQTSSVAAPAPKQPTP